MGQNTKVIMVFILTGIITRILYWTLRFSPIHDLSFGLGLLLDLGVWISIFWFVFWAFGKLVRRG